MKLFLLPIILTSIILNFMYIKKTSYKIIIFLLLSVLGILILGCTYQHYATDEINRTILEIKEYEFDDVNNTYNIRYINEEETVSKELKEEDIQIQISNGYGEVQINERTYIKELEFFNKYRLQIKKEFEKDEPIYIINAMNFMSDEEIDSMTESLNNNK